MRTFATLRWLAALGVATVLGSLGWAASVSAQTIRGRLVDAESGQPIDLGLVIMLTEELDSITSTITNESGMFEVTSPEPGGMVLVASAWGYHETLDGIFDVGTGSSMTVEFRIRPRPLPIDSLVVLLDRPVQQHELVRNGFVRRSERGLGHFITPHDIEESSAFSTEALLDGLMGVRVRPPTALATAWSDSLVTQLLPVSYVGDQVMLRANAGWCNPTVYLDGMRVQQDASQGMTLSMLAPLSVVSAIEVYRRAAQVPVEYASAESPLNGNTGALQGVCGVILVWTRQR